MVEVSYSRKLCKGLHGDDVKYMKDLLVSLGYLHASTHSTFGSDTRIAVLQFQKDNGLSETGIINEATWLAIVASATNDIQEAAYKYRGDADGNGVINAADASRILRYIMGLDPIPDTLAQGDADGDGDIDAADASYILRVLVGLEQYIPIESTPEVRTEFLNIHDAAYESIMAALDALNSETDGKVDIRKSIVRDVLRFAYDYKQDKGVATYPISLYKWGGNLYNTSLKLYCPTATDIEKGASSKPQYYDGGRKEMMLAAIEASGGTISGSDCSGAVVGEWRVNKLQKATFDTTANSLCGSSYSTDMGSIDKLIPADLVGRDGHVGIYVGGGWVVEWVGGAFGAQLTSVSTPKAWDFIDKRLSSRGAWTKFRRPKCLL